MIKTPSSKYTFEIVIHTNAERGFLDPIISELKDVSKQVSVKLIISFNGNDSAYLEKLSKTSEKYNIELRVSETTKPDQHFNNSIGKCTSDFLMLLHDDDEIQATNFISFLNFVERNPNNFSYSCNDYIIHDNKKI